MSGSRKRANYTKEFKEDVLKLFLENNNGCREAAERLGAPVSNLTRWVRADRNKKQRNQGIGEISP